MDTPYGNDSLFDLYLARRQMTPEDYRRLDDGRHRPLMRIDEMCSVLAGVRSRQEKIVVLPDFDCDGVMSGVLGYAGLSQLGFNVALFRPDPRKGYGFGPDEVDRLVSENPGVKWVITCDTGISEAEGCRRLREHGVRVLVTDHHHEDASVPVRRFADVVVDPCCTDETYENKGICGAHVLWQVLDRFASTYTNPDARDHIRRLRVFAGIGTVSDMMPLVGENRQIVRDAVSMSRMLWSNGDSWFFHYISGACDAYRRAMYGLHVLFTAFAADGRLASPSAIDEKFFGFYLSPAINATKRLGKTTDDVFGVFFSGRQRACADQIVADNAERKRLVTAAQEEILSVPQPGAPYFFMSPTAGPGIFGLVATDLMKKSSLPTFVGRIDPETFRIHGSGRAPEWYDCLTRCTEEGFVIQGHEHAFGFSCANLAEMDKLIAFVREDAARAKADYDAAQAASGVSEDLGYDILVDTGGRGDVDLDYGTLEDFIMTQEEYRPYGIGFEMPRMRLTFDWSEANVKFIGGGQHARIDLADGICAMCFFQGPEFPRTLKGRQVFDGTIGFNEFRGERSIQFLGDCKF